MASKFYAVKKGRKPGIYHSWPEAQKQVAGFSGAQFKSFTTKKEAQDFIEPPKEEAIDWTADDTIEAYVDGSFDRISNRYSYGVVMVKNGEVVETFYQAGSDSRYVESFQIAGEVFGSIAAIRWAIQNGYKAINVRYDYMGIEQWATGMWKANKAVSQDYIKQFKEVAPQITVRFKKEKAHTGVTYNELADQLAKKALQ
ncbi:ribonuclease H1 domain-containing protein [Jeotgalibaca ciconiae]|uniref:Ribonuclease H n=1 Tax=Jeotgalibaca ciconiae TaxID=2496265 RepID=A0A3Q9BJC4_9LACT|nr:ribonuclease H family protein [Jeotgalibaca ciconiae]AZP03701.1 reverse transcriptase-like protein [Jeotgalibaca ciconiae]HJB23622.1 ribonuclease H family protein [Candidatus Jeotgalibaca pullicola]